MSSRCYDKWTKNLDFLKASVLHVELLEEISIAEFERGGTRIESSRESDNLHASLSRRINCFFDRKEACLEGNE